MQWRQPHRGIVPPRRSAPTVMARRRTSSNKQVLWRWLLLVVIVRASSTNAWSAADAGGAGRRRPGASTTNLLLETTTPITPSGSAGLRTTHMPVSNLPYNLSAEFTPGVTLPMVNAQIHGWGVPCTRIVLALGAAGAVGTVADEQARWRVTVPPQPAGPAFESGNLVFTTLGTPSSNRLVLPDVSFRPLGPVVAAVGPDPLSPLPGKVCQTEGVGHTFFAQSWSDTCECNTYPKQQPGDQCNWWTQPCGYCCQTCNMSRPNAATCKTFDNVMMLPVMTSRYGYFGDNASAAIACLLHGQYVSGSCEPDPSIKQMGCSKLPKGKCTVRYHDTDMYIATHPDDFVALPPGEAAALCGDAKEDGFSHANPRPGSFSALWWDAGVSFYQGQSAKFFPQLKVAMDAEGTNLSLNGIYQDQELDPTRQSMMKIEPLTVFMPSAGSNVTLKRFCLRARWTAVQRDQRFPPVLELLRERGFSAPNETQEWLADAMLQYSEQPPHWDESFEEHDLDKVIWEAVMAERMSLYWRDALFTEADKVFPGIRHTNAGRYVWDPKHCPVNSGGSRRCRAGVGSTGFNVLNQMLCEYLHNIWFRTLLMYFTAVPVLLLI
jgi:hypothetical protein